MWSPSRLGDAHQTRSAADIELYPELAMEVLNFFGGVAANFLVYTNRAQSNELYTAVLQLLQVSDLQIEITALLLLAARPLVVARKMCLPSMRSASILTVD